MCGTLCVRGLIHYALIKHSTNLYNFYLSAQILRFLKQTALFLFNAGCYCVLRASFTLVFLQSVQCWHDRHVPPPLGNKWVLFNKWERKDKTSAGPGWVTAGWRCEAGRQEEGSTSLEAPESAPVVSGLWTGRFKITATLFMVCYITCGPKMRRKTMRIHCLLRLMGPSVFGWSSSEVSLGYTDGSSWG